MYGGPYMNKWAVTCGSGWFRNSWAKFSVMDLTAAFEALYAGFPLVTVAVNVRPSGNVCGMLTEGW